MAKRTFGCWWALGFAFFATGCSNSPSRLAAPSIDRGAAQAAIAKYDVNGDGLIGDAELNKAASIKAGLKRADKNGDGKISADEIADRIAMWKNSGIGLTRATARVHQNGRPLVGAEITLVPEDFLGAALKPAHGTTDSDGSAQLFISAKPDENGVQLGYYRVQISKKGADGKEQIPPRYNADTELGVEIGPDDPALDRIPFDLK